MAGEGKRRKLFAARMAGGCDNGALHHSLGLYFGVAVAVGSMVGVGILRTPGIIAGHVGSETAALMIWAAGAVYVLLCINYMAELASAIPRSGGPYAFAQRSLGRYGGTLVGWSDFLNSVYAIALLAVALAEFTGQLVPQLGGMTGQLSALLIGLFMAINVIGVKTSSRTQQLTSLVKLAALWLFIFACFLFVRRETVPPDPAGIGSGYSILGVIAAFKLALGTYNGWAAPAYFSGEAAGSPRDVARALLFGTLLVSVTYLAVNLAIFHLVPFDEVVQSKLPAADALGQVTSAWGIGTGVMLMTVLAVVSLPSTLQAVVMQTSRTLHAMSRDGLFFRWGARVNQGGSPVNATLACGAIAIALSTTSTFEKLFTTFTVFAVLTNAILLCGVVRLRLREPDLSRPFRVIGYPWSLIPIILIDLLIFAAFGVANPGASLVGVGLAAGLYVISRRQRLASAPESIMGERPELPK